MNDNPFTFDMFGSAALSTGIGIGDTAFGDFSPVAANDDDPDPNPSSPAPALPAATPSSPRRSARPANFYLDGDRGLASSWKDRARANVAAILVANSIVKQGRPATPEEQAQLIRFTGFGAGELANGVFRLPGEGDFRQEWNDIGSSVETAVSEAEYVSLARCTQYAHFTPEFIIRAIWAGIIKLGWRGGRVLEPGIGTGLCRKPIGPPRLSLALNSIRSRQRSRVCCSREPELSTMTSRAPIWLRSSTLQSEIHPFRIVPSAQIDVTARSAFACTITSSRVPSTT